MILDEFVASTGYARKYAIRLLSGPIRPVAEPIRRPRERWYGSEFQEALRTAWEAVSPQCAVEYMLSQRGNCQAHGACVFNSLSSLKPIEMV